MERVFLSATEGRFVCSLSSSINVFLQGKDQVGLQPIIKDSGSPSSAFLSSNTTHFVYRAHLAFVSPGGNWSLENVLN
jgi:hypothetical protein